VLCCESSSQHFNPHSSDLLNDGGVIAVPPTAIDMKVSEFCGKYTCFMLIVS